MPNRAIVIPLLLLGLSACVTTAPGLVSTAAAPPPAQDNALAGGLATNVAGNLQDLVGEDLGAGIFVRSAAADGSAVRMTMELPVSAESYDPDSGLTDVVRNSFLSTFCEPESRAFFEAGGELRVTLTDPGTRQLDDFVIRSCP